MRLVIGFVVGGVMLLVGLIAVVMLSRQSQDLRQQASGRADYILCTPSKTGNVGEGCPTDMWCNALGKCQMHECYNGDIHGCFPGFFCDSKKNLCKPQVKGSPCRRELLDCTPGLVCGKEGTCVPGSHFCKDGVCRPRKIGETCVKDLMGCERGLICSNNEICVVAPTPAKTAPPPKRPGMPNRQLQNR